MANVDPYSRTRASHLTEYVQLTFNSAVLVIILGVMIKFILLIRQDVEHKLEWKITEQIIRAKKCQKQYEDNECISRVPALERLCDDWHQCMHSESRVQSASLWTQTLAETLNAFVEPISFRSLIFVLLATCALVLVTNVIIASYRVQYYIRDGRVSAYQGSKKGNKNVIRIE